MPTYVKGIIFIWIMAVVWSFISKFIAVSDPIKTAEYVLNRTIPWYMFIFWILIFASIVGVFIVAWWVLFVRF